MLKSELASLIEGPFFISWCGCAPAGGHRTVADMVLLANFIFDK
jgi:hypothetical protein